MNAPDPKPVKPLTADPLESALLAVLRWFDKPMSATALRARVAKLPGPWTLDEIVEAAEGLGIAAESVAIDPAAGDLPPLPVLLPQRNGAAVVVTALEADGAVEGWTSAPSGATNPEGGPLRGALISDLLGSSTGRVLAFARRRDTEALAGDGPQGRYGHWFFGPLQSVKGLYGQVSVAALMTNVFALATSIFSMIVYDRVIPHQAIDTLLALLAGIVFVFVSDFAIRTLRGYFLDVAGARADMVIADAIFEQMLDMQMRARRGATGSLASIMKEFESLREFLTSATLTTLIDIPFAILFLAVIWVIGGPMAWVPLAAIPVMILASLAVQPSLRRLITASQEDGHNKHAILVETISGLETVKAIGASSIMRQRWQKAVTHQSQIGLKSRLLAQLAGNIANLASQSVQVGIVTVGVFLSKDGSIGFGAIIACTLLAGRAIAPLAQFTQLLTRINQSLASYRSLNALMSQPREHERSATFLARPGLRGEIEFRDVVFSYPDAAQPTLDGVSFRIAAGERVAILGRVGSGKTTIAKLILGLYRPDSGAVLIDGVDVRQIDPADLRRQVGVVLQDVWLMSGSVRQNIALGAADPTDAEILEAAEIAGVDDFIRSHPQGYALRVGERGEGLSGGQRQAVAIARALVSKPPMLLLDEPTSAMDAGAEKLLVQRLAQAVPGRTFMVVTHKSAMLNIVERVIILEKGKVAMQGPPDQVFGSAGAQPPAPTSPAQSAGGPLQTGQRTGQATGQQAGPQTGQSPSPTATASAAPAAVRTL